MGRKKVPGLLKRGDVWHVDKYIRGRRVCESTGAAQLEEAERYLVRLMEAIRQEQVYGVRPTRTFEEAAAKFVSENTHKRSLDDDILHLKLLMPWIGATPIHRLHMGSLQPWIERRRREGRAVGTINHGLQIVRRVLNLAASEWVDEQGLTWLHSAPKIKLLPDHRKRQADPLSWEEQQHLFAELPDYLAQMALFAVNSGCRDQEVCLLRWEWEVAVTQLQTNVFIIPGEYSRMAMRGWLCSTASPRRL